MPTIRDVFELAPLQEGMLFEALRDPSGVAYRNQLELTLRGPLDLHAFARAWQFAVDRHDALRTGFHWEEVDRPVQVVHETATLEIGSRDLRDQAGGARKQALREAVAAHAAAPMDLARPPLMRLDLFRMADEHWHGVWTHHHLVLDGWSLAIVFADAMRRYEAEVTGVPFDPPAPLPFRDFVLWLRGADQEAAERFWSAELAGLGPGRLPRPGRPGTGFGRASLRLDAPASAALRELARQQRVTLSTVAEVAWALTLRRYGGGDDVVFGSTVAGRPAALAAVDQMVGLFINTLPVRTRIDPAQPVGDLLRARLEASARLRDHEHTPLARVQTWSEAGAGVPLFDTLLVFENFPLAEAARRTWAGVEVSLAEAEEHTHYPLTLTVLPGGDEIVWECDHLREHVDEATARGLLRQLEHVLSELIERPGAPVGELAPLPGQVAATVRRWSGSPVPPGGWEGTVVDAFAASAHRAPDAVAIATPDGSLTYEAVDRRSRAMARGLRATGTRPGSVVAVRMARSAELAIGLLGVLRAGAACLPIDPELPDARAAQLLTAAQRVLTEADLRELAGTMDGEDPPPPLPGQAAFVIFTSGSTGVPKGVVVSHAAQGYNASSMAAAFELTSADRVLQFASPGFDVAAEETYPTWLAGGAVVVPPAGIAEGLTEFHALLDAERVSVLDLPASFWHLWTAELADLPPPAALRVLAVGSEMVWTARVVDWRRRGGAGTRVLNVYGSTEMTITSTVYEAPSRLPRTEALPVGRALPGTTAHVLDRHLDPLPPGVDGELFLGGAGVALGYLGEPARTAERFLPDPNGPPGSRVYRMGDMARWLPDGVLVLAGRADAQVKIRGQRVEPAEVEAAVAAHPDVRQAAVVTLADPRGEPALAAYVVLRSEDALDRVVAYVADTLPAALRPTAWTALPALPLQTGGKVDRQALPPPDWGGGRAGSPPATATEQWMAATWSEVLGRRGLVLEDDFFALGGHSLAATQIASRVRRALSVAVPVSALFEHPTLGRFSRAVDATRRGPDRPQLVAAGRETPPPLSYTQERLWLLQQLDGGSAWSVPAALRLDGPLDVTALERALGAVVARHEVLRTSFPERDGLPVQRIARALPVSLPVEDCSDDEAAIAARLGAEAARPFDLAEGPVFRLRLLRLGEAAHVLLVNVHHIAIDGWSHGILLADLARFYEDARMGRPVNPNPPPVQYADFAAWQRSWLRGRTLSRLVAHWRERLEGAPPALELPADWPRGRAGARAGGTLALDVPPELAVRLRALARESGATLFMALLAAFAVLLHRYSGQRDLVVGTPVANRTEPRTEHVIGAFINTLPLRVKLSPSLTFREVLAGARAAALDAYEHQDLPFERLVEAIAPERDVTRSPIFQAMLVLQNAPYRPLRLPDVTVTPVVVGEPARLDLTLTLAEDGDRLVGLWEYDRTLFQPQTIARLSESFATLLAACCADPDRPVGRLPVLTPAAVTRVVRDWNAAARPLLAPALLGPDTPAAFVEEAPVLTRAGLDAQAARVAGWLLERGIGRGDRVGLCVRPGPELLPGIHGILRAGAAYVPLDPGHPDARLAAIASAAGLRVAMTQCALAGRCEALGMAALALDAPVDAAPAPPVEVSDDDEAYVLFTSGSTGAPKGVVVTRGNVAAWIDWFVRAHHLGPADRVLQHTPYGFDVSVAELLMPVAVGAAVVFGDPDRGADAPYVLDLARRAGVTCLVGVPTFLRLLADDGRLVRCEALRLVMSCGEALPMDLARALLAQTGAVVDNEYGPTETAVTVTSWLAIAEGVGIAPLGRPPANSRVYVLDGELQPVPPGVAGELCIGGLQVARGYLGAPGPTAERFLPDPFAAGPGARMYRSGDRGRHRGDGILEFLGRADRQVKVRGFRVEPAEVEAALRGEPGLREAAVVPYRGDLVAYVLLDGRTADGLREALAGRLPAYLVPSRVLAVDAMPVTPNGKLDAAALLRRHPPEEGGGVEAAGEAPRTGTELVLAEIWQELLGIDPMTGQSFFALGGQSLLAARMVALVRRRLGVELPLRTVFEAPSLAAVAGAIDDAMLREADVDEVLRAFREVEVEERS
jgi:amino acid adenylation domain-containing protein